MNRDAADILKEALALPADQRAALAGSLISSLDEEPDEQVEEAWGVEIARRLAEIDSGRVKLVSWAEARRQFKRQ
jgi:putative addiction module component (TIGR02574 family)